MSLATHPRMLEVIGEDLAPRLSEVIERHVRCGDRDAERLLDGVVRSLARGQHPDDYWLAKALKGARPAALELVKQAIKNLEVDRETINSKQRSLFE